MEFRIDGNPDYGQLTVTLGPGDKILAEGVAMAWMTTGLQPGRRLTPAKPRRGSQ